MSSSQRTGWIALSFACSLAAVVVGSVLVVYGYGIALQQAWTVKALFTTGCLALTVPAATCVLVRGLRRGERAKRWALCVILLASGGFFFYLGALVGMPLPEPAEQAVWEGDHWWVVPLTYSWAAASLLAALPLLLPQVGDYLSYRRKLLADSGAAPGPGEVLAPGS